MLPPYIPPCTPLPPGLFFQLSALSSLMWAICLIVVSLLIAIVTYAISKLKHTVRMRELYIEEQKLQHEYATHDHSFKSRQYCQEQRRRPY